MTRTGRTLLAIVLGIVTALAVTLGSAHAGVGLQCGDMVSCEVTLTEDLDCTGTEDGLIVVGDDTTINLNRHTISGDGCDTSEAGIVNDGGYDNVTIKRGTLAAFCRGLDADGIGTDFVENLTVLKVNAIENDDDGFFLNVGAGVAVRSSKGATQRRRWVRCRRRRQCGRDGSAC